jgi:putative flippase GtrA
LAETKSRSVLPARRFFSLGVLSTVVSYGLFVFGGLVVEPFLAHAIGFSVGLAISVGGLGWIFDRRVGRKHLAFYGALYLMIFFLGQLVVFVLRPRSLSELLVASWVLLVVGSILAFLGGRAIAKLA